MTTPTDPSAYQAPDRAILSHAWVMQTYLTFGVALLAMALGILQIDLNIWARDYLGVGLLFTVVASINLSKTVRDQHEAPWSPVALKAPSSNAS